jgi:hypothetical protein
MKKLLLAAMLVAATMPTSASAVNLKNIRPCYGPLGAMRLDRNLLPGDVIFMTYDVEDLVADPKTKKVSYSTTLELLDAAGKVLYKNDNKSEPMLQLGGTRIAADLHLIMGPKQEPGRYSIRLTVRDLIGKDAKAFSYDFQLLKETFGMIGVFAPAVGFPGNQYRMEINLVNMTLDNKNKPNVEMSIRILEGGRPVADAVQVMLPRDLPDEVDLAKTNFFPYTFPVYLNRAGRFTMEIVALDKNGNKRTELTYPFTVIDINSLGK